VVVALELQLLDLGFELIHDDVAKTLTDIDDRKQNSLCLAAYVTGAVLVRGL